VIGLTSQREYTHNRDQVKRSNRVPTYAEHPPAVHFDLQSKTHFTESLGWLRLRCMNPILQLLRLRHYLIGWVRQPVDALLEWFRPPQPARSKPNTPPGPADPQARQTR
jgi:hypothetical protein